MRIALTQQLDPGSYADMRRNGDVWDVYVGEQLVQTIKNSDDFKSLSRDSYKLLGLDGGEARVIRFADIHRHSDCSLLDGMSKVKDIVAHTEYAGALTDHGNMYGFLEYYKSMKKAGKKPILGFEGYMVDLENGLTRNHVILLAKNEAGVHNLFKLTSEAYDHFYHRPHVTWEMLEKYRDGVMCSSACLSGIIPHLIRAGDDVGVRKAIEKFISIFGKEDFYLEIQRHGIEEEQTVNPAILHLAREYGLKVIATTDSHYPTKDDAYPHEILLCIGTKKTIYDPDHMKYEGTGYHLQTSEEMEQLFWDVPEALDNTLELADKVDIDLELGKVNLPKYSIPEEYNTPLDYLKELAKRGFTERFKGTAHENDQVYLDRFQYEIDMIERMGFASYFIIVWDFINYARNHNIYVGPGRGSAAGSIIAYCLGITDLDPIKYKLLFERFLNPERVSWPDVDTDIEYSRRPEVIAYMTAKYGEENVCHIVTFGTLAAKQAVQDVSRTLGNPASFGAHISNLIPSGPGVTIDSALKTSPDFLTAYQTSPEVKQVVDIARRLEGNKRHASQHACGLVCSPSAVSDYLPTSMELDKETGLRGLTSQVTKDEVEEMSLIKMDLLGLKTLGVIHEIIDRVQVTRGLSNVLAQIHSTRPTLRYQDIPLDDRKVYQMLAKGQTGAVFQLESEGMSNLISQMFSDIDILPEERLGECFERLIAAVALYRPGPMDYIPNYIAGLQDHRNIKYLDLGLKEILEPTYGVIVYQEQVMQIVQKLAGYTLGRADVVRKAMGKKKQDLLAAEKHVFINGNKPEFESGKDKNYAPGCVANGIPQNIAEAIWDQMSDFAKYA